MDRVDVAGETSGGSGFPPVSDSANSGRKQGSSVTFSDQLTSTRTIPPHPSSSSPPAIEESPPGIEDHDGSSTEHDDGYDSDREEHEVFRGRDEDVRRPKNGDQDSDAVISSSDHNAHATTGEDIPSPSEGEHEEVQLPLKPLGASLSSKGGAPAQPPLANQLRPGDDQSVLVVRGSRYQLDSEIDEAIRAHRYNKVHEPRLDDFRSKRCSNFQFSFFSFLYLARSLGLVLLRFQNFFVLALAILGTWFCNYFQLYSDLPMSLLATAVVFPVSFGIQYTFNRRERALLDIASMKASATSLFVLSREWPRYAEYRPYSLKMGLLIKQLLRRISRYVAHHEGRDAHVQEIYRDFDEISHRSNIGQYLMFTFKLLEELRVSEDWIKSVISRAYQYVRYLIADFERLRVNVDFHTPSSFRSLHMAWLSVFPILISPYFAKLSLEYGLWAGYYTAIIASLTMTTLSAVVSDMEDPFTGGIDSLNTEMIRESVYLMFPRKKHRRGENRKVKEKIVKKKGVKRRDQAASFISRRFAIFKSDGESEARHSTLSSDQGESFIKRNMVPSGTEDENGMTSRDEDPMDDHLDTSSSMDPTGESKRRKKKKKAATRNISSTAGVYKEKQPPRQFYFAPGETEGDPATVGSDIDEEESSMAQPKGNLSLSKRRSALHLLRK